MLVPALVSKFAPVVQVIKADVVDFDRLVDLVIVEIGHFPMLETTMSASTLPMYEVEAYLVVLSDVIIVLHDVIPIVAVFASSTMAFVVNEIKANFD